MSLLFSYSLYLSLFFLLLNSTPSFSTRTVPTIASDTLKKIEAFLYARSDSYAAARKSEHIHHSFTLHGIQHYVYFPEKPRWVRMTPMTLTYAFSNDNLIDYLSLSDIQHVFKRAFSRWASVIPVSFMETNDYGFADIKIGFYSGDHGDGEPFDGVLGILAHSFSPMSGRLHLDAAERWAVDFRKEKSMVAVDLESVAVHEIGHLLGLGHSLVKEAVMYPSLKPRDRKVDLHLDDIEGVQALYGSNPNYTIRVVIRLKVVTLHHVELVRKAQSLKHETFWEFTGFGFHRNFEVKRVAHESTSMMGDPLGSSRVHMAKVARRCILEPFGAKLDLEWIAYAWNKRNGRT
ncbi:hypothetical protein D8674_037918 [Pyrus ussuriensis x Pyrus communis]|uniref:Peptidase metallopeptidase domain-containing protein n=1 Tax=Pyrus ussuriensis x Pyrus communis TaxID=2448454 RepID=A0A5N5FNU7_9ROSA|nr:hypothetical protein D8674_037918 [Pyrus ussuriensis x Pyrus communis]